MINAHALPLRMLLRKKYLVISQIHLHLVISLNRISDITNSI